MVGSDRWGFSPSPPSPMEEKAGMRRGLFFKLKSPHPVPLPAGRGEGVGSNCAITNWFYLATFKHYCGYVTNLTAIVFKSFEDEDGNDGLENHPGDTALRFKIF
jgi:hypothetical protein